MKNGVRSFVCVLGTATLVAGCSSGPTRPLPSEVSVPTFSSAPTRKAPPVEDPLRLDEFAAKPCRLLVEKDLTGFDLGDDLKFSTHGTPEAGASCIAKSEAVAGRGSVTVSVYAEADIGSPLENDYRTEADRPDFQAVEVQGFPGVRRGFGAMEGACVVTVGTGDDQGFRVVFEGGGQDACGKAEGLAGVVVRRVRG